jgi:hypothetical protein
MTTSMSTNNKSLASKRIIMVRMTFLDSSCDFSLLNSFSVSRVAKSANSSKAVIFILQTESSKAYNNCLAHSLS